MRLRRSLPGTKIAKPTVQVIKSRCLSVQRFDYLLCLCRLLGHIYNVLADSDVLPGSESISVQLVPTAGGVAVEPALRDGDEQFLVVVFI